MHQYHMYGHQRRERGSYFLPFLSLIMVGLIVVLLFQIVDYFQDKHLQKIENKAAITIASGRGEMKLWGVDRWTKAGSGSIVSTGDSVKTGPGSRIILSLLNGSSVRLDSETEVELIDLKTRDGQDSVQLKLVRGQIWMKRSAHDTVSTGFRVSSPHLSVMSLGTIFNVAFFENESVHVIDGKVDVEIHVQDDTDDNRAMRVAEKLEVALGQEISVGPEEILDLRNRRPIELLALLSDEFRNSEWFSWNRTQDASGDTAVSIQEAAAQRASVEVEPAPKPSLEQSETVEADRQLQILSAPLITSPQSSPYVTTSDSVVVLGETSPLTQKIEVTTRASSKVEMYALQKYTAGSTKWSYVASPLYGNLSLGENYYEIVALGKNGARSPAATLTIKYNKSLQDADLSAPRVTSFDGNAPELSDAATFQTVQDEVIVLGSIGQGIAKIVINDFELTRFVPGSTRWSYYAKKSYGNLSDGPNVYRLYGIDAKGNKTKEAVFTIIKKPTPKPVPDPTMVPPPSPETEGSENADTLAPVAPALTPAPADVPL